MTTIKINENQLRSKRKHPKPPTHLKLTLIKQEKKNKNKGQRLCWTRDTQGAALATCWTWSKITCSWFRTCFILSSKLLWISSNFSSQLLWNSSNCSKSHALLTGTTSSSASNPTEIKDHFLFSEISISFIHCKLLISKATFYNQVILDLLKTPRLVAYNDEWT